MAKRRANGEGNIRKRKDGRWEGRYTAGTDPETGKQIFKNVLGKTQAEVKEKLKRALEEAQKVDFTRTGKYTVEQWMEMSARLKFDPHPTKLTEVTLTTMWHRILARSPWRSSVPWISKSSIASS